jgi:uncharacterized lipoprotein YddW (UPF0748 family)
MIIVPDCCFNSFFQLLFCFNGRKHMLFIMEHSSKRIILILWIGIFAALLIPASSHGEMVLDVFDFATTDAVRLAWSPVSGSSPVELFEGIPEEQNRGVKFPCNFDTVSDRCCWDYSFTADLSSDDIFTIRMFVENQAPISSITLYFKSPGGWFANTVSVKESGWQTLRFVRAGFHESSTPAGWDQITGIRFSVWKGSSVNTEIIATGLRLYSPPVKIIQGSWTSSSATAENTANLIAECLDAWSIEYGMVTDEDVETKGLGDVKLVILPYNSNMPEQEITHLKNFINGGGKLIAFYLLESSLADLLGINITYIKSYELGAMNFTPGIVDCIPERVEQASWNIHISTPSTTDTQVLAYWEDADGVLLDKAAWLISPRGAFMTHILLDDDINMKKHLIFSIVSHFLPELREGVSTTFIENIMPVGHYEIFDEAVNGILKEAESTSLFEVVQNELKQAVSYRTQAIDSITSGLFCETLDIATSSRLHLLEGYYLVQQPKCPEFRAIWESAGTGIFPGDWDASARILRNSGFNAVIPIVFTAGMAHFNSSFLPHSDTYNTYGDQVSQCVTGCHNNGIEAHPRKITWNLLWTDQSFIDDMRNQGRTQVDVDGNPVDYLCPSDPRNYQLEFDSIMEVVTNYDIDGFHYDFIRYPSSKTCYCDPCRDRFTSDTGHVVVNWPDDCYSGSLKDEYREWRREQITRLVRSVHDSVKVVKPHVKISAAVFQSYPYCRDSVGQDWVYWMEEGYVDFVCPMNYTPSLNTFTNLITNQQNYVKGVKPLYPGISLHRTPSSGTDQIIAQISITRNLDTGGFVLFNLVDPLAETHFPNLTKGLTKPVTDISAWYFK